MENMNSKPFQPEADPHEGEWGRCPYCGCEVLLPCLACRVESLRYFNRAGRRSIQEEVPEDLSLNWRNDEERSRYEQLRSYREKYDRPMFGNTESRNESIHVQLTDTLR